MMHKFYWDWKSNTSYCIHKNKTIPFIYKWSILYEPNGINMYRAESIKICSCSPIFKLYWHVLKFGGFVDMWPAAISVFSLFGADMELLPYVL